jgi:hypothetical protein
MNISITLLAFRILPILGIFAFCANGCGVARAGEFGISGSHRHITLDGKPFFWLGDTVWLLSQLPTNEELEIYLKTRAEQGFTVIQFTAVMGEERVWGTLRKTTRGDLPFLNGDVSRPATTEGNDPKNEDAYDYWDHLDHVLNRIHTYGLRAALVTYFVGWQGEGYKFLTPQKAHGYGKFLGQRYATQPEIIWILGGDNTPNTPEKKEVWNLVAKGIAEGVSGSEDYSKVLMTYHINGGASSSQIFHDADWLDFNMAQTWDAYGEIYRMVRRDYDRTPPKPCGLGEGAYEDGPQYPTKPINALVIRKQANWSFFAGGYHTYGNGNVWHFDTVKNESTEPWKEALRSAGAESLRHTKAFLESIEWWRCVPDDKLISEGKGDRTRNVALLNTESNAVAVYLSSTVPIQLSFEHLRQGEYNGKWVNPATGQELRVDLFSERRKSFDPPQGWADAFLVIKVTRKE